MNYEFNSSQKSPDNIDLLSFENLDRASPELWSQQLPGLNEYTTKTPNRLTASTHQTKFLSSDKSTINNSCEWMKDLGKDDIALLNELSTLSSNQLIDKVKDMIELAYQLGLEESNQMTRGRFLNILDQKTNDDQ